MQKDYYSRYELPGTLSLNLRERLQSLPPEIVPELEELTEKEIGRMMGSLPNTMLKYGRDCRSARIYLADSGHVYRVRLNCVSGENELLQQACEDLMGFIPSDMLLGARTGSYNSKELSGRLKNKEKLQHLGRRNGRRPAYLLGQ